MNQAMERGGADWGWCHGWPTVLSWMTEAGVDDPPRIYPFNTARGSRRTRRRTRILLVFEHFTDVPVCGRCFLHEVPQKVFGVDDPPHRLRECRWSHLGAGLLAAHHPSSAVRARAEALLRPEALDEVARGPHRSGDEGQRAHRNGVERFIGDRLKTGRYGNASEVVRAGLRLLEDEEAKLEGLRAALDEGEASPLAKDYSLENVLKRVRSKRR